MTKKQPAYNIRYFFEDGMEVTKENSYLSKVNKEVSKFQSGYIVKQLNGMPKEIGEPLLKRFIDI